MWVMPSPRMREISAARQYAITKGLTVKKVDPGEMKSLFDDVEDYREYVGYCIGGSSARPGWSASRKDKWSGHHLTDEQIDLVDCTEGISHLISRPGQLVLIWNERGGEAAVDNMVALATQLNG